MEKEEIRELCKKIHLDNAKRYFKTKDFDTWVDRCQRFHLEVTNEKN